MWIVYFYFLPIGGKNQSSEHNLIYENGNYFQG